jgi:hypothetical protein
MIACNSWECYEVEKVFGDDERWVEGSWGYTLVSSPWFYRVVCEKADDNSEVLHPWVDGCVDTNFRRFFDVFVS